MSLRFGPPSMPSKPRHIGPGLACGFAAERARPAPAATEAQCTARAPRKPRGRAPRPAGPRFWAGPEQLARCAPRSGRKAATQAMVPSLLHFLVLLPESLHSSMFRGQAGDTKQNRLQVQPVQPSDLSVQNRLERRLALPKFG